MTKSGRKSAIQNHIVFDSLLPIYTSGHSPGHICFYERDNRLLFSGDLIYKGTLDAFYPTTDPILFRNSVGRIKNLSVKRIFPGHYDLNISPDIIDEIADAFDCISEQNKLCHGGGIFDFGDFKIHI